MKNIILIIFVMITFIACKSKEEKEEFLSLMKNSTPYWEDYGLYIDSEGNIRENFNDYPFVFDKIKIYKDDFKEAIYKSSYNRDYVDSLVVRIQTNIIYIVRGKGKEEYELEIAIVSERDMNIKSDSKELVKNNSKITDLSKKIKLIDFRICSDRDVERFLKDIDSLSEKERRELSGMLLIHLDTLTYNDRDRLYNYYRKVKNEQTYKFD